MSKTVIQRKASGIGTLEARLRVAKREGWGRWVRSPADEAAVLAGCVFSLPHAERVQGFFRQFLRHTQGQDFAGKPFELLEWQWERLIGPLFGWIRPDGTRRYRRTYVEVPKKNGKSALASGIGLYLLCADGEPGAHVYSAAVDRPQAGIVHGEAILMVQKSAALSKALKINKSTGNISYGAQNSFYQPLAGDGKSNEGRKPHGIIVDELHAWKGRANFDSLQWGFAARRNPLLFVITTAGDDPLSVCRQEYDYAKELLTGKREDMEYLPLVYEAEQGDDLDDEKTWHKANPSLGATITLDSFRADHKRAKASPAQYAAWKRYRVNMWISAANPWLNQQKWAACAASPAVCVTPEQLAGLPCYFGLDMGAVNDLSALAGLWPEVPADLLGLDGGGTRRVLLTWYWMPQLEALDPMNPNLPMYRAWAELGLLEVTDGDTVDAAEIRRRFTEIVEQVGGAGVVRAVAVDKAYAMETGQRLQDDAGLPVVWHPQNLVAMTPGTTEFERIMMAGELLHAAPALGQPGGMRYGGSHPILNWMAGNVALYQTADGKLRRPIKPANGASRKIDGIVAAVMATSTWIADRAKNAGTDSTVATLL